MPDKYGWVPPDPDDVALAIVINQRLPAHAHVTPTRKDNGDETFIYGWLFEYFDARKHVSREYRFFDPDEVVRLVKEWINDELPRYRQADNWVIAR